MFCSSVKFFFRGGTYFIVVGLEIQFLLFARLNFTRLKCTIVHDRSEKSINISLLKRDYPLEFGNNVFLTAELSFRSESYLIVAHL